MNICAKRSGEMRIGVLAFVRSPPLIINEIFHSCQCGVSANGGAMGV